MLLVVVNRAEDWPFDLPGTRVVTAREYLTERAAGDGLDGRVLNLCRFDRHQDRGYYVSLLAEARGHRPLPDVKALEDMQSPRLTHSLAARIEAKLDELKAHDGDEASVDSYFGRDPTGRYPNLSQQLYSLIKVPLLRAHLSRAGNGWRLRGVQPLSAGEVPTRHRAALEQAVRSFLNGQASPRAATMTARERGPRLAILRDASEREPASNPGAIAGFQRAAHALGMATEVLGRHDLERLADFDALFIRDTTNLTHYTYDFSRRALAAGLVVIDDPDSILQCTNKVFLNELLARHRIPMPKTLMVHRDNLDQIVPTLGLPCILKQPDSAFSRGVAKFDDEATLFQHAQRLFERSELIIAQQFLPTAFDWRVGILDKRPLYVCKYHMAPGHWQIIKHEPTRKVEGKTATVSVGETPQVVVRTALRAANLIGDGLYGVDLKQVGDQCYLIEVNDNATVDAGAEDRVLGDALYREIMGVFYRRILERQWKAAA